MGRILSNLNPLTEWAILFISVVGCYFQVRWSRRGSTLGPTLLTTLGIFFCFVGIAVGLADFDPNDVKASVPHLLQGIRTSFWASVSGIGWALTIKIRLVIFGDAALAAGPAEGATVDDLARQLVDLNAGSVAGNQRLERMIAALEQHAQRSAEAGSLLLVKALAAVVQDFNTALNEQFGGNFKRLNEGVERLVAWQRQYESQLNLLIEQETRSASALSQAAQRFSELVDASAAFVTTAESMSELIGHFEAQRERLGAGLSLLAGLVDKAADGLPTIEKSIVEMTAQIGRGVQANQDALSSVLKSSWQSIQVHNQHLTAMLAKSLEAANKETADHSRLAYDR